MQRTYLFDNAAEVETAERFASLDVLYNFRTFRFLETTGIGSGWHCLEVGGGSGAVAAWMADRVGPGLTEVGMEGHLAVREGGSPGASLDAATFAQVRQEAVATGLITDAEIDVVLMRLEVADFTVVSAVMFTSWGRRPQTPADPMQ